MTRKRAKSASPEWFAGLSTPEATRTPRFGFRVPRQNAIVHADLWSSGECRFTSIRGSSEESRLKALGRFTPRCPRHHCLKHALAQVQRTCLRHQSPPSIQCH